jgi:hypothetical protein
MDRSVIAIAVAGAALAAAMAPTAFANSPGSEGILVPILKTPAVYFLPHDWDDKRERRVRTSAAPLFQIGLLSAGGLEALAEPSSQAAPKAALKVRGAAFRQRFEAKLETSRPGLPIAWPAGPLVNRPATPLNPANAA